MKPTNKYIPFTPKEEKTTSPLHVVLTAWFCGCTILLFFFPQIKAYVYTTDDEIVQQVQRITPLNDPLPAKIISESSIAKMDSPPSKELPTTIPQRILLIGSSSMNSDLGAFLAQSLRKQELYVHRHAKVGSGLARPDFYDWMDVLPDLIAEHKPELVIAQFIGNDCQSLIMSDGSLKAKYGTKEWKTAYEERITALITLLHKKNIRIAFLGMSNVESPVFRKKLKRSNEIIYNVASKHKVPFISLWETTSTAGGAAESQIISNSISRRMHQEDGIHLSRPGARMVAREIFTQLQQLYEWKLPQ